MPAYLFCQFDAVTDRDALARYLPIASASIAKFGGTFLVRADGPKEVLEDAWDPRYLIVVEFPDADTLRAWYHSDEYAPALEHRRRAGPRDLILAEGVSTAGA